MLNRLETFKNWLFEKKQQDIKIIPPVSTENDLFCLENSDTCSKDTDIYVWNTTPRNIGHVAMKVKGVYLSLWPYIIPACGPTVALPLPSRIENTLNGDMLAEDGQNQSTFLSDPEYHSLGTDFLVNPDGMAPDHILSIPNLNTEAMQAKIENIKKAVDAGEQYYQLFPKINLARFFSEAGVYLSHDPIDIHQLQQNNQRRNEPPCAIDNCATIVAKVLQEGGLTIKQENLFMGVTPNSLARQVDHHIRMSNKS